VLMCQETVNQSINQLINPFVVEQILLSCSACNTTRNQYVNMCSMQEHLKNIHNIFSISSKVKECMSDEWIVSVTKAMYGFD